MTDAGEPTEAQRLERIERGVRAVREGHGANCSSIGSVIDTLFASAVLGGAIFSAVAAALAREKARVVGPPSGDGTLPSEPIVATTISDDDRRS